jgi:hypothetical protein
VVTVTGIRLLLSQRARERHRELGAYLLLIPSTPPGALLATTVKVDPGLTFAKSLELPVLTAGHGTR